MVVSRSIVTGHDWMKRHSLTEKTGIMVMTVTVSLQRGRQHIYHTLTYRLRQQQHIVASGHQLKNAGTVWTSKNKI